MGGNGCEARFCFGPTILAQSAGGGGLAQVHLFAAL